MGFIEEQQLESAYVMGTYARKPVELVRGRGMRVEDAEGRTYLDFVSGVGAVSLGHCHPALVSAIEEQASTLVHVSNYYYIEHRGQVGKLLSDALNEDVPAADQAPWQTFFANSGAEANECAIKLARAYARRRVEAEGGNGEAAPRVIVTVKKSFHGRTLATLAATAQPAKQELFQPLPDGFTPTPQNDIAALEALFEAQGDSICAVMLEPIQGESGVHPCSPEFMEAVRRLTAERHALMICDEVQCGIYRTGKPFGFQNYDVVPDIVSIAKGVASGFPCGMCAARGEVAAAFKPGDHGSTFGGSNLAVAAAEVTLSEIQKENLAANAIEVGAYLREQLSALPQVTEVRGMGLMLAADLAEDGKGAPDVVLDGLSAGLLLNATGAHTLRFLPPLVCSRADVDALIEKLGGIL
ncbi:aspartate aminotransferase family protein [Ellagibacter isourolithinifaciens]|uniref:aspartate aminotransferase family protein n=1 Tax=Ellagibacter isourolithinifaciens TaxID=2137581 RepID=UPI003A92D926